MYRYVKRRTLEPILLELAHQRAVADLQLSGGELTVTLDVSQCLGKLVTFELLMNASRGFFQGTRQVQEDPTRSLCLTDRGLPQ